MMNDTELSHLDPRGRTGQARPALHQRIRAAAGRLRPRRVPLQLQMSAIECGAACLAMILSYHGRQTRVAETWAAIGIGRDGATARAIVQTARKYGLRVKSYSVEPAEFRHIQLPAIAHWDFNHFVVVERWSPQRVEIVDPGLGRRSLTAEEFSAAFTGVVLTFELGAHFQPRRAAQPAWRAYLQSMARLPGAAGALAQILAVSVLLQLLGLAFPALTAMLIDRILPLQTTNLLPIIGVGIGLLALTQLIAGYLRAALLIYVQSRLDTQLMLGFFEHLLALPFRFFQGRTSGDLLMRLGSNQVIREILTGQTVSAVLDGSLVVVYLAVLLLREPLTGLLALVIGLLQVALLLGSARRIHALAQQDLVAQAKSQSYLIEALNGIVTLKVAGAEDEALDHWSNLFFNQLNVSLRRKHISALIDTAMNALRVFAPLILLWVGTGRVLDGTLSLGTMLALNALAIAFLTPLASLVATGQQLQLVGAHLERIADVVEAAPEQDQRAARLVPQLAGRIELRDVSFQYDPGAPLILRDLSLTIEPGQKVALVGRTGSGKSTLVALLLGLYPPTSGEILYDGIRLGDLDYQALRDQFGVVLQDSFLFSGSIRQNVALHDPGLSLDAINTAARLAAIDSDIARMPMGYETLLAEGGAGLSGGQRQRLALARALARRPAILLLDEATSHLDAITEAQVEQNLADLACTRIVIAHRLSTIRNADLILILQDGAIVERGTHDQLLAMGGQYAALVRGQTSAEGEPHARSWAL
jgi:ATP-binding cassette, subfamily B, bacterial